MEDYQFRMINVFNNNFKCNDVKKILKLYKKDISFVPGFEDVNFKEEKYRHPLFKNYNYCLFCGEKQKTKYYSNNIIKNHMQLEENNIGEYLQNKNIKLRELKNKKEKIAKRRFIHSYDKLIDNNKLTIMPYDESDTELYVYDKNNYFRIKKLQINNSNSLKSFINEEKKNDNINSSVKQMKKSFSNGFRLKPKNKKIEYNYADNIISPRGKSYLINKSTERKMNLECSNFYDNIDNIDNVKIDYEQEKDINKSYNNKEDKSVDKNSISLNISNNDFDDKKTKISFKSKKTKNNKNSNILIESSNNFSHVNSEVKVDIDNNKTTKEQKTFNFEEEEDDKVSNKSNKLLDVFEKTKNFLGFGKRTSLNKFFNHRAVSSNIGDPNNNAIGKNPSVKEGKFKQKKIKNYSEKNDNCSICLQEIKEKFTLTCGDFFCRDCMRNMILTAIKEIVNLDKLSCPSCEDQIEENTIKKLLTEEEFEKYHQLITKIEGLKNKDRIPCPYPDCPGWAEENQSNHNILICINGHEFCKKCLQIVDLHGKDKSNKHKCYENITEEESQTMQFFKNNKNFRKCPRCQSMVVREGGDCNNMTCTNIWCGYEFCWICNRKYDDSHYRNPLSMCFGLSEMNYDGKLAKYSRMRFCRCILIFMLIIFIILPIIIVFFSIFEVCLYIITFVLDGSAMKNIKLKSIYTHKIFYKLVYGFFIAIGFAYIPVGYMSLVLFAIAAPIICIINNFREKTDEELE